jgi:Cys-tRNA synthase (O-phospho-L-seryl-tRNA:Cys-tRNA synthase)
MIAFVGSSMASTVEVEFSDKKESATVSLCSNIYQATYIAAKRSGANDTQAGETAWAAYSTCVDQTISPSLEP